MALLAVRAQLPGMAILMARQAGRVKAFESLVQVANFDLSAISWRDVSGVVTLFAAQAGVAAQQRVPGLAMVEFVLGRIPFDDLEVLAIMLRMAARAIQIALARADHAPVEALTCAD